MNYPIPVLLKVVKTPKPTHIVVNTDPKTNVVRTVVHFADGTKAVVTKTGNDANDLEKALLFAVAKRAYGKFVRKEISKGKFAVELEGNGYGIMLNKVLAKAVDQNAKAAAYAKNKAEKKALDAKAAAKPAAKTPAKKSSKKLSVKAKKAKAAAYQKKWYADPKNKAKKAAYMKKWNAANKDRLSSYQKKYRQKAKKAAYAKKYYQKNKAKLQAYSRAYYASHKKAR